MVCFGEGLGTDVLEKTGFLEDIVPSFVGLETLPALKQTETIYTINSDCMTFCLHFCTLHV